jgi:hypothetical protein
MRLKQSFTDTKGTVSGKKIDQTLTEQSRNLI